MDTTRHCGLLLLVAATAALPAQAQQFSTAEPQLQNGDLRIPEFAESGIDRTAIGMFQRGDDDVRHDLSVFADTPRVNHVGKNHLADGSPGGEPAINLGSSKILQARYDDEIPRDIGLTAVIHYRVDAQGIASLPAIGASGRAPGSGRVDPDVAKPIHAGKGGVDAPAQKERGSAPIDLGIASKSFQIGKQYSAGELSEVTSSSRVLSRPQMLRNRGDATSSEKRDQLLVSTDYQFWSNKFEKSADENAQTLAVWKF